MFRFKQFAIKQDRCAMKVGMDGVLLGAWAALDGADRVLDIGTGTGLIALMAAQRNPQARIHAVEIEQSAYGQALENRDESPWSDRVEIYYQSIQEFTKNTDLVYEAIISNPPYFQADSSTKAATNERQLARSTQKLSYLDLLFSASELLCPQGGRFSVILPVQEGYVFIQLAQESNLHLTRLTQVSPREGKPANRFLIELQKQPKPTEQNELTIRNAGNTYHDYTQPYIQLVKDFYLKM